MVKCYESIYLFIYLFKEISWIIYVYKLCFSWEKHAHNEEFGDILRDPVFKHIGPF